MAVQGGDGVSRKVELDERGGCLQTHGGQGHSAEGVGRQGQPLQSTLQEQRVGQGSEPVVGHVHHAQIAQCSEKLSGNVQEVIVVQEQHLRHTINIPVEYSQIK